MSKYTVIREIYYYVLLLLLLSSLGVFSNECSTFLEMMNDIGIDRKQQQYVIKKMINLAIRVTHFSSIVLDIRFGIAQAQ